MSSKEIKAALKEAKEAVKTKDFKNVILKCKVSFQINSIRMEINYLPTKYVTQNHFSNLGGT